MRKRDGMSRTEGEEREVLSEEAKKRGRDRVRAERERNKDREKGDRRHL